MKRLNKKGLKFESALIGLVVFSLFIVGGTLMMVDLNYRYGEFGVNVSIAEYGDEVYNTTTEMANLAKDISGTITEGDISEDDSASSILRGVYSSIRFVVRSYRLVHGIINAVATEIGVPDILVEAAFTAFVLIISFSIVYLVFRFIPK